MNVQIGHNESMGKIVLNTGGQLDLTKVNSLTLKINNQFNYSSLYNKKLQFISIEDNGKILLPDLEQTEIKLTLLSELDNVPLAIESDINNKEGLFYIIKNKIQSSLNEQSEESNIEQSTSKLEPQMQSPCNTANASELTQSSLNVEASPEILQSSSTIQHSSETTQSPLNLESFSKILQSSFTAPQSSELPQSSCSIENSTEIMQQSSVLEAESNTAQEEPKIDLQEAYQELIDYKQIPNNIDITDSSNNIHKDNAEDYIEPLKIAGDNNPQELTRVPEQTVCNQGAVDTAHKIEIRPNVDEDFRTSSTKELSSEVELLQSSTEEIIVTEPSVYHPDEEPKEHIDENNIRHLCTREEIPIIEHDIGLLPTQKSTTTAIEQIEKSHKNNVITITENLNLDDLKKELIKDISQIDGLSQDVITELENVLSHSLTKEHFSIDSKLINHSRDVFKDREKQNIMSLNIDRETLQSNSALQLLTDLANEKDIEVRKAIIQSQSTERAAISAHVVNNITSQIGSIRISV